jgi:ABC-type glycerol-3-phosphate transport system permease component
MSQIPDEILESARIDGAGEVRILYRIVMPNVKPAVMTMAIFCFQELWRETGGGYIYNEELKTLPTAFSQITTSGIARAGIGSAITLLMMIPPIIIFFICQRRVMETMTHSGIKG